jgi:putative transposase
MGKLCAKCQKKIEKLGKKEKGKKGQQLALRRTAGHGGKRIGAGRKKKKEGRRNVVHLTRPGLGKRTPVHVTLRMKPGRPSLRTQVVRNMFEKIVKQTRCAEFHVATFSLQRDHVHLICEPEDVAALSAGIRRVAIRFALRMNRLFGRKKGKIWGDRYHRHDLKTPREVRNALVYLLMNDKKHGECAARRAFSIRSPRRPRTTSGRTCTRMGRGCARRHGSGYSALGG